MKKIYFAALVLIAGLILMIAFNGCLNTKKPMGLDYDIRVVADSSIWQATESLLREIFEKVEYVPQPEKAFQLIRADLHNFKRYKNLLFLSTLNATDEVSQNINASVNQEIKSKIAAGNFMFVTKNEWADPQMVMFLMAPDLPTLQTRLNERQAEIFFQFDNYWNTFHEATLFKYKESIDIEKHLSKTYGWTIRIPVDFKLQIQSASDRFVMFRRQPPSRWLSVYWIEATDPSIITKEWCIAKRNEIGKTFYENEEIEQKYQDVLAEEVIFLNRRALYLKGLWKHEEKVAGGPFRLYCFFDEPTERIYFIDMHVFSPDLRLRKMHYLRQMEIIAKTFRTSLEAKPNQQ